MVNWEKNFIHHKKKHKNIHAQRHFRVFGAQEIHKLWYATGAWQGVDTAWSSEGCFDGTY